MATHPRRLMVGLTGSSAPHYGARLLEVLRPGFYHLPPTVGELIDHTVTKILDQFGIHLDLLRRWEGIVS